MHKILQALQVRCIIPTPRSISDRSGNLLARSGAISRRKTKWERHPPANDEKQQFIHVFSFSKIKKNASSIQISIRCRLCVDLSPAPRGLPRIYMPTRERWRNHDEKTVLPNKPRLNAERVLLRFPLRRKSLLKYLIIDNISLLRRSTYCSVFWSPLVCVCMTLGACRKFITEVCKYTHARI